MFATPSLPPSPASVQGSTVLRFGTAVGTGTAASFACVIPATLRVSSLVSATEGTIRVWVALAAAAFVPMVLCVLVLRSAREGLRAFGGVGVELRAYAVVLWLAWLLVALSIFGSILRATTHQHALAGVTYGFGAVAIAVGSAVVCARIFAILRNTSAAVRRLLAIVLAALTAAAVGWVCLRFLSEASRDPASAGAAATVLDVLAFSLAAGFAARPPFATERALALVGPPIAVTLLALGALTLRDTPLRDAIDDEAPAFSVVTDVFPGP
ncbi:MAG: hypothetical protein ABSC94_16570 [Polyangiaceae bacterium]|jgi:hypothetical protein